MNTALGPTVTCDTLGLINAGFGVILLIFNCGPFVFSENRAFQEKMKVIRGEGEEEESGAVDKSNGVASIAHS